MYIGSLPRLPMGLSILVSFLFSVGHGMQRHILLSTISTIFTNLLTHSYTQHIHCVVLVWMGVCMLFRLFICCTCTTREESTLINWSSSSSSSSQPLFVGICTLTSILQLFSRVHKPPSRLSSTSLTCPHRSHHHQQHHCYRRRLLSFRRSSLTTPCDCP